MRLVKLLNKWTERRLHDDLLRRYGGVHTCPWCTQTVQKEGDWSIFPWERDPMIDVITCGPCGGKSLWRFEIVMFYIGPLEPPKPKYPSAPYYDIENARLRATS